MFVKYCMFALLLFASPSAARRVDRFVANSGGVQIELSAPRADV